MDKTHIAWTDATWNPLRGCSMVSDGCTNCYAMKMAHRFSGPGKPYEGLTRMTSSGPKWNGTVRLVPEVIDQPLRWRKPRRIFVNSMSDLFHEDVPDEYIDRVFAVMQAAPQHTFQVLTKRPERFRGWFAGADQRVFEAGERLACHANEDADWPLPNVWLGVSVENQKAADERIPLLLDTPAAVRFLSCEPLLGALDFDGSECRHENGYMEPDTGAWICQQCEEAEPLDGIDWVIVGGESGPGARPCDVGWIRSLVKQCGAAGVPCFVKQLGADPRTEHADAAARQAGGRIFTDDRKGADPSEWPEDLRVQQWPEPPS